MNKDNKDLFDIETYNYNLPEELIAQTPAEPRDSSRLLVFNKENNTIEHKRFYNIIDYLNAGDVLVVNNTKVIPARLMGIKQETNAKIEVLLLKRINLTDWEALLKPGKRAKVGTIIKFSDELSLDVLENTDFGGKIVRFIFDGKFEEILDRIGVMPLPPYIHEKLKDKSRYNTVYSKINGSSAAPTAGLHFTKELLEKIKNKGIIVVNVLLHVGLGTFRPVEETNILDHKMHTEHIEVTKETCGIINKAKEEGRRVIAVGTTSIRTLESSCDENGKLIPTNKDTGIFIYPGYKFKIIDGIITNFHLPKSTLIMLISAFAGLDETMNLYNIAVKDKYRFFSFGDAMFLS